MCRKNTGSAHQPSLCCNNLHPHLSPVDVLALLDLPPKLSLDKFELLPVPCPEGSLFFIQEDLDVPGDPRLIVGETRDSQAETTLSTQKLVYPVIQCVSPVVMSSPYGSISTSPMSRTTMC